jgi:hypothetical protein
MYMGQWRLLLHDEDEDEDEDELHRLSKVLVNSTVMR